MINRLNEILLKKGDKFVNDILKNHVVISEKLDTFRIQFEKNDGEITFFTKDNKKIDKISRTLNGDWEDACVELPILIENANVLPGYRYGLYYSPTERPLRIPYTKIPKYILTDISKRDKFNKITESLKRSEIEEWAGKLCMGKPPVIFEGTLTSLQQFLLLSYGTEDYSDNYDFADLVKNMFGSTYSKEPIIEGIIIQSDNNLAQIVSYEFDLLNEAYEKVNTSRDLYDLILISLNSFMDSYKFPILESIDNEIKYIDLISDIFNKFCQSKPIGETLDPKYLTPIHFGENKSYLNRKFIKNKETLYILDKAPVYESLFKIMISSFRKYKKPYGLLDESAVKKFNNYVFLINQHSTYNLLESGELNEAATGNITVNSVKDRQPSDIDNMRVISSIQRAFTPRTFELEKGKTECVIYLTNYIPFTQAQLDNVNNMKKQWNCNVVLAAVSNSFKIEGNKFRLSDELVTAQMKTVQEFNSENIDGFIMLDSWSLLEIFEFCRPKYEPIAVITDMGKKSELALQLFFEEEVMRKRISVDDNFNIGEMENKDALSSLRSIEDENFSLFNELVPSPVKNYYNNIVNEYKLWSGAVLKQ